MTYANNNNNNHNNVVAHVSFSGFAQSKTSRFKQKVEIYELVL